MDWQSVVRPLRILARQARRRILPWRKSPRNFAEALAEVFGEEAESQRTMHVPAARAELFHTVDNCSTELETLNFLHALICSYKPRLVLETGTFRGMGTIALASALQYNGLGRLVALDSDSGARRLTRRHVWFFDRGLLSRIDLRPETSLDYLRDYQGEPFEFAFLDSVPDVRPHELKLLLSRDLLAAGAIVVIHDTSRPYGYFTKHAWLDELVAEHEGLEFPFSRGFRMVRFKGLARQGSW